ncbi:hypothetical protein DJ568_15740 [Mucilaginibacter hurinus]|uniref:Uncharacterized protein n=1 Tax=Mucilaginibacter hurinus TaxID=2201324 RepID=A0A367GK42_9SPHI|nr:hypothetical protein DJ568_15740 [Mucilaginibacter hurinus]
MTIAFLNIGTAEMLIIFFLFVLLTVFVANYGRDTPLGYWGSVLLCLLTSPPVAFLILFLFKSLNKSKA